jgi:hypothetical protein
MIGNSFCFKNVHIHSTTGANGKSASIKASGRNLPSGERQALCTWLQGGIQGGLAEEDMKTMIGHTMRFSIKKGRLSAVAFLSVVLIAVNQRSGGDLQLKACD